MSNINQAIEYAKQNPNSAFAYELRRRIESGQMNTELESAGLNQYITTPTPSEERTLGSKVKSGLKSVYKAVAEPVANLIARPGQAVLSAMGKEVPTGEFLGLNITAPKTAKDVIGDVGRGLETVALGIGGGAVADIAKAGVKGAIKQGAIQGAKQGAIAGGMTGLGQGLQGELTPEEIAKSTLQGTLIGGVTGGVLGGGIPAVGAVAQKTAQVAKKGTQLVTKTGKETVESIAKPANIMQRVARVDPTQQVKFKEASGETIGEYLTNRKIFGNTEEVITKVVDRFKQSKNQADEALAKLTGVYKPTPVKTVLNDLFTKEKNISSPGALSSDFKRVLSLKNKFDREGLTMSEINEVKRLYERNVKLDFMKQNLPEGVKKANTLDDALRKWQFTQAEKLGLKNLPELNKETRSAKMLADALAKKYGKEQANNAVSLTDWIVLTGADPATAVSQYLVKKIFSSKGLQSKIAQKLSKKVPEKTVKPIFGTPKKGLEEFLKSN